MSVFTEAELEYLASQRLGRIATVGADGQPHVVPTSFRYDPDHDAIDVGGMRMSQTKKLRDVQRTGRASIVIDDVLPPWQPRMIEVRWTAAVIPSGGKALNERFDDTIVRIQPARIIVDGYDNAAAVARLFGLRECRKKKKKNQPRGQEARTNQGSWSQFYTPIPARQLIPRSPRPSSRATTRAISMGSIGLPTCN